MEEVTQVWALHGMTGSTPGYLSLTNGRVRLDLDTGADDYTSAFDVQLSEISDVKWPRMQFSAGCNFVVNEELSLIHI